MSTQFGRVFTHIPDARQDYLRLTDNRSICGVCVHLTNGGQLPLSGVCSQHTQITKRYDGVRCVVQCDGYERWSGDA